jgi:hypothetical protein
MCVLPMCEREGGRGVGSMGKGGMGVVVSCGHCTSSLIRIKRREGGGGVILGAALHISTQITSIQIATQ